MAKNMQPVLKRCRTLGIEPSVMGIDKSSNRTFNQRRKKQSEYGMQLNEKQKVRFIYGVLEKQFAKYYVMATKMNGVTGECLLQILESRLDNVIYRMGLANTRREARQIVNHGHVTVNGKRVDIPSYLVKPGEVISLRESSRNADRMKDIVEVTGGRLVPDWLEVDAEKLQGTVKELPSREQIDVPVDEMLIVELYSK